MENDNYEQLGRNMIYGSADPFTVMMIVYGSLFVFLLVSAVGFWKVFKKAGEPGWAALVPLYNCIVLLKIAGRPWWWLVLLIFVPLVNVVLWLIVSMDLAKAFGKNAVFCVFGLFLLPPIGLLILGLDKSQYQNQSANDPTVPTLTSVGA
jgi:hypothetical protein